jgi:hypothetical protein
MTTPAPLSGEGALSATTGEPSPAERTAVIAAVARTFSTGQRATTYQPPACVRTYIPVAEPRVDVVTVGYEQYS